jgi:hypothetical protein
VLMVPSAPRELLDLLALAEDSLDL